MLVYCKRKYAIPSKDSPTVKQIIDERYVFRRLVDVMFTSIVVPLVNDIFGNGFPLPVVDGLKLINPEIVYGTEFITLASDFAFVPVATSPQALFAPPSQPANEVSVPIPHMRGRVSKRLNRSGRT